MGQLFRHFRERRSAGDGYDISAPHHTEQSFRSCLAEFPLR